MKWSDEKAWTILSLFSLVMGGIVLFDLFIGFIALKSGHTARSWATLSVPPTLLLEILLVQIIPAIAITAFLVLDKNKGV